MQTPSCRFPLQAGGTEHGLGSPREAGGTSRRGKQVQTPSCGSDKGTSLEFTVCEARTLFRPHPQPLSHAVGEGRRGARRCALQRVPPLPPAGEGDKGGEGNTAHLLVRACAGKNSPCFKDFVPNRCTLTSSCRFPLQAGGTEPAPHSVPLALAGGTLRRGETGADPLL